MPVGAAEVGVLPENVIGFIAAEIVVPVPGDILPILSVDGPAGVFAVVTEIAVAGVDEFQVLSRFEAGVHPMVVGLFEGGGIVPVRAGGEEGFVFWQADLHAPVAAGQEVEGPDDAAYAAVGIGAGGVVDGCSAVGGVADDAIVGFQAAAGPWAAHGDVPEFDGVVIIKEGAVGGSLD